MVFTIDPAFATELLKEAGEYRKKELFEFRAFSAKTLAITRGAETVTFTKVPGSGENPADKWTISGSGATRDADAAKMDDLLAKLSNLRADTFVAAAPAQAAAPIVKVTAEFDENKKEEAGIGRDGAEAFGTRPDEAGAMQLNGSAVDEALKALDDVLAPPPLPLRRPRRRAQK
jgi:hypothetical protein